MAHGISFSISIWLLLCVCRPACAQSDLRSRITNLAESISGDAGIALRHIESGDTLMYHGGHPFPMQSVYKLPLGLAVMSLIDNGALTLDEQVRVGKDDYFDTHSPMKDKYPNAGMTRTVAELMDYMIKWSDNVACDLLFGKVGGPRKVDLFVHGRGIRDMAIRNTEREMHANDQLQYQNWSTPVAMMDLLVQYYTSEMLTTQSRALFWTMLADTQVGKRRIKGELPSETVVAHRTGTGGTAKDRTTSAVNDVGIIQLPDGSHLAIVVFISNTHEDVSEAEDVIASIARLAYDFYGRRR